MDIRYIYIYIYMDYIYMGYIKIIIYIYDVGLRHMATGTSAGCLNSDWSWSGTSEIRAPWLLALRCMIYYPYITYTHRIHGAAIYANMTGVYGWDPCYHI